MGFRYRKSIKLPGGVRINLSKRGVGWSWGVPGYRRTYSPGRKSRTTYSIPGTGLSYVKEDKGSSTSRPKNPQTSYQSGFGPETPKQTKQGFPGWLVIAALIVGICLGAMH